MSSDFAVKVVNFDKVIKKMRKTHMKLKDRKVVNKAITTHLLKWVDQNFVSEGKKVSSTGWKPLAASTEVARAKGWGVYVASKNPKILQNKGKLKNDWSVYYSTKRAVIESNAAYSIYHEVGSKSPKGRPPKRKILPTNKMIEKDLRKIYGHFIKGCVQ